LASTHLQQTSVCFGKMSAELSAYRTIALRQHEEPWGSTGGEVLEHDVVIVASPRMISVPSGGATEGRAHAFYYACCYIYCYSRYW